MTGQQWRLMPARRAHHDKKEENVCSLGENVVSHHNLAVQFRCQGGRTDIVALLEQTNQVCQCTRRGTHHLQSCITLEECLINIRET